MNNKKNLKNAKSVVKNALMDNLSDLVEEKKKQRKTNSQEKQALEMGISKSQLSKYLCGDAVPNADAIYTMAKYYNCSADYILGLSKKRTADINEAKMCDELGLSEKAVKLLKKWQKSVVKECPIFLINYLFDLDYFKYLLYSFHRYIYGDVTSFYIKDNNENEYSCKDIHIFENQKNIEDATIIMKSENYDNRLEPEYINKIHEILLHERLQEIKKDIKARIKEYPNLIKNFHMHGLK